MPGYGIPEELDGVLPWSWAEERLAASHNYWLATASPGGTPHVMPVWGVWVDGGLWFSTGEASRKARNLAAQPRCVVTTERADEAVIVEGRAIRVDTVPPAIPARYREKYGSGYPPSAVFVVRPRLVFGFIERDPDFATAATRWRFPGED
jgi:hypothetical protein